MALSIIMYMYKPQAILFFVYICPLLVPLRQFFLVPPLPPHLAPSPSDLSSLPGLPWLSTEMMPLLVCNFVVSCVVFLSQHNSVKQGSQLDPSM